jgi:hypothetical protein
MAVNLKMANAAVNAEADALSLLCDSGKLRIYDGSQPAAADDAIGAVNLLAEFTLPADCFPSASAGVLTANAITNTTGLFAATATWYRVWQSNGTTPLMDGSVGTATSNLVLNSADISVGVTVSITSWTHTVTK